MKIFLKIKHWQLFIIWILGAILFGSTLETPFWILTFEFYVFLIIGWIYSINKVIKGFSTKKNKFDILDFLFIIYMISIIPFGYMFKNLDSLRPVNEVLFFISGSIGMICAIILIINAAISLKRYETKRNVIIFDVIDYLLLLVIIPIGIWKIQPKLNKILILTKTQKNGK